MSVLEKEIEGAVCYYARKAHDALTPKFEPDSSRGWPDRIIMGKGGNVFFIEFKAPGEPMRPLQEYRKGMLEDKGFRVYLCDDVNVGKSIVDAEFCTS